MTGPSEAMKAAFPPKLSEGAEKLREYVAVELGLDWDTSNKYHANRVRELIAAIVTELGINPEMVEDVRPLLQPSSLKPHAMNQNAAAIALSTLLEVAGQ